MNTRKWIIPWIVLILSATMCGMAGPPGTGACLICPEKPEISEMRFLIERFSEDESILRWAVRIPLSGRTRKRFMDFYEDWRKKTETLDFDQLGIDGQIDWILFENLLKNRLYRLEQEEKNLEKIGFLLPFGKDIAVLEENRQDLLRVKPEDLAESLVRIGKKIEAVHRRAADAVRSGGTLEDREIQGENAYRAAGLCRDLGRTLKHWKEFYHGYDPMFTWWCEDPYEKTVSALDAYEKFLKKQSSGVSVGEGEEPVTGHPIGREALQQELDFAMIAYTPEELIRIGEREYNWCLKEMIRASEDLGYGREWRSTLEYVKTCHESPGQQPYLIRKLAEEAIEFLESRDLISIPPLAKETWKIEMMSPERQKVNPFFTGGRVISVSFPTNTMSHQDKLMSLRGNNRHFSRATVHHELIPGHHLQGFMAPRSKPYRRIFYTPFWLEGWALHWEMLFWDLDFAQTPEDRIGMLFWRIHRCARIIFSLRFHLGEMSAAECIDFLVDGVGHERANAVAEVRRSFAGDYPPLYQCAYMLGGLQIRSLYHEWVDSGKMTPREFHDAVLHENNIPIEMLRARLAGQPLDRDYKAGWRFDND